MLTQKENTLLQDLKSQEKLCVEKYAKLESEACDDQLKSLFHEIGDHEQTHLDTIEQIINGMTPSLGGGGSSHSPKTNFNASYDALENSNCKKQDAYLCSDALSTEKHVSSVYNTDIFEFKDNKIRDTLNHIQKEEQQHGEEIYNYMKANSMY